MNPPDPPNDESSIETWQSGRAAEGHAETPADENDPVGTSEGLGEAPLAGHGEDAPSWADRVTARPGRDPLPPAAEPSEPVQPSPSDGDRADGPEGDGSEREGSESDRTATGLGTTIIRRRRKGVTAAVLGATALIVMISSAIVVSWWFGTPESPVDSLGLGSKTPEVVGGFRSPDGDPDGESPAIATGDGAQAGPGAVDPEQLAFLELHGRSPDDLESGSAAGDGAGQGQASFTDHEAIARLAGAWAFDLGAAPRHLGGPDPTVGVLGTEVVRRRQRERLTLELFRVWSRDLPELFTLLKLPEGRFMTFEDGDGVYRFVLEDVQLHGDDVFSYRLSGSERRRYAHRLDEDSPERDRQGSSLRGRDRGDGGRPGGEPRVLIEREPGPGVDALWRRARELHGAERYHGLKSVLDRILRLDPGHGQAAQWRGQIPQWIETQRQDRTRSVQTRLGQVAAGLEARDLDRILAQWGGRADRGTRNFFRRRIRDHERIRAWVRLNAIEVYDGEVELEANFTVEGSSGRRRDASIEEIRWRGRFENGWLAGPFPE